jgi:UDP-GlcNAc:undecaprenyl-phosphate GlcNAc-1-phosphate transferase
MHTILIIGTPAVLAFLLCLLLTPLCRDLFIRLKLMDHPDEERKFHAEAVPRMGGVPIVLSYAAALFLVSRFPLAGRIYVQHAALFHALLPAAGVIFLTGLLDDLIGLRPWQKLLGQFAGASMAIAFGARLSLAHTPSWISIILSGIWLIGCTNAVNLIDGMDGLATGVGLLATLTTLLVALLSGNVGLALATAPLAACLLAFLRYNFHPASVFLGDCGSLTIGFVLGCFGLIWSQRTGTMLGMVAPLMALSLPLLDVGLAIGRRFLRSVPIFQGDRGHIHHRVLALGFSTRTTALMLYAVCAISASLALLESLSHERLLAPVLILFCTLLLVFVRRLGYIEFTAARKVLSHALMRSSVQEHIYLEELNRSLVKVDSIEDWWAIVRATCKTLRFSSVVMEWQGRVFREQFMPPADMPGFRIQLGLDHGGMLILTRAREPVLPDTLLAVLQLFQVSLRQTSFVRRLNAASDVLLTSNAA